MKRLAGALQSAQRGVVCQSLPALLLVCCWSALGGCTAVDFDYPRQSSTYLTETADTYLAGEVALGTAGKPAGHSGFYLLVDGIDAAAARFQLIERAERSIDVQYYLIKQDQVGQAFILALLRAADRGVRVRLLVDDMFTTGTDADLLALDSLDTFEVRVFNPFNRGLLGRNLGAVASFARVNRRMHNKSLTIDNQITIIGGRNIADEYFGARTTSAFGDLDVIGIGPIVTDVSTMFDRFWSHERSVPVEGFMRALPQPDARLADLRQRLLDNRELLLQSRYADAVIKRAYSQVETDISVFRWAPYELLFDSPDKSIRGKAGADALITAGLGRSLSSAKREVTIISPYFVPRTDFRDQLIALQRRGIDVTVVTNSLAANNQKTVHGGYAPSRAPLLENGVQLYELRPDARVAGTEYVDADAARSTLHAKAYVVDRSKVFIGSFNFDPRSANINTEMGVVIDDPQLGGQFVDGLNNDLAKSAWQLGLSNGKLTWSGLEDGVETTQQKEPMTRWWQRWMARFYQLLPIRSQL